ncbi:MAG: NAD(+)/NADH kinase [Deltaproteobacteria bacterium]|nr:NAD(+)/NADH kinase [Deltaproteobacteria bacterium]TDI95407.1 MAG: NAD(+) kinase [Deltaproteobacteria bacterium]TDJ05942.1 MAG: NAD(+) kinase [Deltaproteobacteria bacterium]
MIPWKRIGVALKSGQSGVEPLLRRIVADVSEHGLELILEREVARVLDSDSDSDLEQVAARADLLIVLGGDGSMLAAARAIGEREVAILGINVGRLGFLADVSPDEVEAALAAVLGGDYRIRERSRLEVTCLKQGCEPQVDLVLNDAVITKGTALARLIELEVLIDQNVVASYRSDGLIIATPTGSTAYNLSAGGPLVDPRLRAMIINPICPHTLTQRPLVLPDSVQVEVRLLPREEATLTLDGQVGMSLQPGDAVRVTRSARPVRFVTVPGHDLFETLRKKLGWGSR